MLDQVTFGIIAVATILRASTLGGWRGLGLDGWCDRLGDILLRWQKHVICGNLDDGGSWFLSGSHNDEHDAAANTTKHDLDEDDDEPRGDSALPGTDTENARSALLFARLDLCVHACVNNIDDGQRDATHGTERHRTTPQHSDGLKLQLALQMAFATSSAPRHSTRTG